MPHTSPYVNATTRLRLRPLVHTDADVVCGWLTDDRIKRPYLLTDENVGVEVIHGIVDWSAETEGVAAWAIEDHTGHLVAMGNWRRDETFPWVCEIEVTLGLVLPAGRGYGTEAHSLIIETLLRDPSVEKVTGRAAAFNEAIIAICAKLGFRQEGRLRAHARLGGEAIDLVVFGLLREDWHAHTP